MNNLKKWLFVLFAMFISAFNVSADSAKQVDFLLSGYDDPTSHRPLSGGKVWTFLDGTSTLAPVWTDKDKGGVATNPVILDSSGKAEIYGDNIYKFVIYDDDDALVEEVTGLEYKTNTDISDSLLTKVTKIDTIADLRTHTGYTGESVQVLGYYTPGDGGGGPPRLWNIGAGQVDDGASVIVPGGTIGSLSTIGAWVWPMTGAVNINDFGCIGDCSDDGIGTDNTLSLRRAMDYGRNNSPINFIAPDRAYKTRDFVVPSGCIIDGTGIGKWDLPSHAYNKELDGGTTFVIFGTPDNTVSFRGVTDMSLGGGVVPNPDTVVAGDANYALLNFMNSDATLSVAATPKQLKVGVLIEDQSYGSGLRNCRVMLNNNGINGYNDAVTSGLGDDWDIGVLCLNSKFTQMDRFQSVGYWRMAAMAQINVNAGNIPAAGSIFNSHKACYYQGYKGLSVRGNDVYRVTAVTSTTVEIPWTTSNPFEHTGGVFIIGGAEVTYTSASAVGDKLTFTGLSLDPTTKVSVSGELAYGTNIGVASFNVDESTCITDLQHTSRTAAHYLGFSYPSEAVEVSGFPIRDVEIQAHMFSTDVVAHLHDCQHIDLPNSFVEATGWKASPAGVFEAQGSRFICSSGLDGTYPAGKTDTLNYPYSAEWNAFVDFAPMERASASGRYPSASSTGLFKPSGVRFAPKGPYTSDFPFRAYDGPTTLATKNGELRIVRDNPFREFATFEDTVGSLILAPEDFGGLQISQQTAGKDPRMRLSAPTNFIDWDLQVDDSDNQKFQIRREGIVTVDISDIILTSALRLIFTGLPTFADETAAAGLPTGEFYKTATGELRIKL